MYGPVLPNALSGLGLLAKPDLQLYPNDDPITPTLDALQAAAHSPRYPNADDTYALVQ